MAKIPQIVKDAASELIGRYGSNIELLGKYEGADAYIYNFPDDSCTGFPFVYLHKDNKVTEITGFEALDIVNLLVENLDELSVE
ncbi:MAG: hypothetical protein E7124_03410 [Bacteroidales bacterium]|nr:hypothetical protein [Bacteroidales bacterium]